MNLKENALLMKNQTFGVEIEMSRISQRNVVEIVQDYFNQKYGLENDHYYEGSHLHNYVAEDHKGRKWNAYSDCSISGADTAELVTPILTYEDIEDLQEIVRLLRQNGAISDAQHMCGVHIHIGVKTADGERNHTPKSIRNLVNVISSHQFLLHKAIGFTERRQQYCHPLSERLVETLNAKKPTTWDALEDIHYGVLGRDYSHYSSTRYYFLNLHAIWDKNTIEFRCFEFHKNMHAGELKAYIQLCLAMSNYAKLVRHCRPNDISNTTNQKYSMNSWLKNLGLIGDEFKTARKMLMKRLSGDTAYRNGRHTNDIDDLDLDLMGD